MSFKTKELAKAYRQRPDVRARKNAKDREKYKNDPDYRAMKIKTQIDLQRTTKGRIQARLRIMNHDARKGGYAECHASVEEILSTNTGKCALCREDTKALVLDHDHITGKFRGWLCGTCNSGLGYFNDDTTKLALAINYLHKTSTIDHEEIRKDTNPKDLIGSNKVPLSIVPGTTKTYLAIGHLEGHEKYGYFNWRSAGVRLSVYLDALERHIEKLKGGEWVDPSTNVPHLANAITCLSIIIDAHECGKLTDDRPASAPISEVIDRMSENVVGLKKLFDDKKPIDYFITGPKERE